MRYFLKIEYPGSPSVGTIVEYSNDFLYHSKCGLTFNKFDVEQYSVWNKMPEYVIKTSSKGDYTTHQLAKKYGLKNYHYWIGKKTCLNGSLLMVTDVVIVNDLCICYILMDSNGVEYLSEYKYFREFLEEDGYEYETFKKELRDFKLKKLLHEYI
jgi:hypothetical protein